MEDRFRLFPESASSVAPRVDALYLFLVSVSGFFTLLICALILYFGIRYRRGATVDRANPLKSQLLELVWTVVPFVLTMIMFLWGATLYFEMQQVPSDALQIDVLGKQWMWKIQHPQGNKEVNELHVPVNQPVRLRMISEDVIHSFYLPAFRVKQDVLPGYYTHLSFTPTRTGRFHLFCAEYCGTEHSLMRGSIFVMDPADYAAWLSADETGEPVAAAGAKLFERFRCGNCHKPDGSGSGPSLVGIYGEPVPLSGGGTTLANDQYLRNSILNPAEQVVAGFQPLMPSFEGQLEEAQVLSLIAYVKALSPESEENE